MDFGKKRMSGLLDKTLHDSGTAQQGPTYPELRKALLDLLRRGEAMPEEHSVRTLAVEEAFELMNSTVLGRGLEEEPQTAAMMMALAAGARIWAPWFAGGEECAWVHVSKSDEGEIGVDFAIVLATDAGFRIYVCQAKRITNKLAQTVNITQPGSFRGTSTNAAHRLRELLVDEEDAPDSVGTQYQLTKLLELQNAVGNDAVAFIYVLWPDAGGEPLYRKLEDVRVELAPDDEQTGTGAISQVIKVEPGSTFRSLLLGHVDDAAAGGLLDLPAAQKALHEITRKCKTTVAIDVSGKGLKLNLAEVFSLTGPDPLPPATGHTKGNTLG